MSKAPFPTRKISETLIDFAQPILALVDNTTPPETLRTGLEIAVTLWNAYTLDRVNGNQRFREMIEEQLGDRFHSDPIFRILMERRELHFTDDLRLIADVSVSFDPDGYRIKAAAKDPYATR